MEEKRDSVDETYQAKSVQWVKDSLTSAVVNLKERLEKTNRLEKEVRTKLCTVPLHPDYIHITPHSKPTIHITTVYCVYPAHPVCTANIFSVLLRL